MKQMIMCLAGVALASSSACASRGYNRLGEVNNVYNFRTVTLTPFEIFIDERDSDHGCNGQDDSSSVTQTRDSKRRSDENKRNALLMVCLMAAFEKRVREKDDEERIVERNTIVNRILFAADMNCDTFFRELRDIEIGRSGTTGTLNQLASATGTIATDALTSRIASASSLFLNSVNDNFGNVAFRGRTIAILAEQNANDRKDVRSEINQLMKKSYSDWNIYQAISDSYRYNSACNVTQTLENVERRVAAASGETEVAALREDIAGIKKLLDQLTPPPAALPETPIDPEVSDGQPSE